MIPERIIFVSRGITVLYVACTGLRLTHELKPQTNKQASKQTNLRPITTVLADNMFIVQNVLRVSANHQAQVSKRNTKQTTVKLPIPWIFCTAIISIQLNAHIQLNMYIYSIYTYNI